jgi:Zn-dependent M28 family amino/carboxypeptidase
VNKVIKVIFSLLIKACVVLVVILLSTFGWTPLTKYKTAIAPDEVATSKRVKKIVSVLSEDIGRRNYEDYENLEKSAAYIIALFEEMDYTVEIMSYEVNEQVFKNITAFQSDIDSSKETIIIGAHYDSCFNPGADDNASGVAGVIELARLLKEKELKYNLKFVAFANEEPPFFHSKTMGSFVYANEVRNSDEKIKGAVILEMIGYFSEKPFSQKYLPLLGPFFPNKGNFVAIVGNFDSKGLVKSLYSDFKLSERFPVERIVSPDSVPGINFSDHWSFWKVGIPAVMVTDTAYLRNNHYHKQSDLPNTLDFNKMAKVIHGLKYAIMSLD